MLNDTAAISGVLGGFIILLMGDNLFSMIRSRIEPNESTIKFRQYLNDLEMFAIIDAAYLVGFVFIAYDAIFSLLTLQDSVNGDTVMAPLLMFLSMAVALVLRVSLPFLFLSKRAR